MPKAKLTFPASDSKKVEVAAHFANVTVSESAKVGNDLYATVSYRDPQSLVKMGNLLASVSGTELEVLKKAEAEKAAKTAAKK